MSDDDNDNDPRERWDQISAADGSVALQIELLRAFVGDFPDHYVARAMLGDRLSDVSRYVEGERLLRQALDACPSSYLGRVQSLLGQHYRDRGDFAAAEAWFRRAIDHAPSDASAYVFLGGMFARVGRLNDADQLHRLGTACDAGCVDEAYLNLGLVLRALERYEEALECFEHALAIDPGYRDVPEASRDVVNAMWTRRRRPSPAGDERSLDLTERWDENMAIDTPAHAIEAWRTFAADFPRDGYGLAMLGMKLVSISKFGEAEDVLRRALGLLPPEHRSCALLELGETSRHQGRFAAAEALYRKEIDDWPFSSSGYTYLGAMCRRLGRLEEAERLYRKATACEPKRRAEAHHDLGIVLRSQGRYAEALECFELARSLDPDDDSAPVASQDVVSAMRVRAGRSSA